MRVLTYPDPFNINDDTQLWEIVSKYPHLCASNTLLQGLADKYGREKFSYLTTVERLMEKLYKKWLDDPSIQINIYLEVSRLIKEITEEQVKKSFQFNKKEVTDAVIFLITLKVDISKFDTKQLTKEQIVLLDLYTKIKLLPEYEKFKELESIGRLQVEEAIRDTLIYEIQYEVNTAYDDDKQVDFKTLDEAYNSLSKSISEIEDEKAQINAESRYDLNNIRKKEKKIKCLKHLKMLLEEETSDSFKKIVIHGVHRITPIMYFMIEQFKALDIEVIFLVNYCENIPTVYGTWDRVYSWCGELEGKRTIDLALYNKVGRSIAQLLEGHEKIQELDGLKVLKYDNLTTFANEEVSRVFREAENKINHMKKQYYAVKGKETNEILKVYYPEQFKEKQFLSYPIGQFILGIYKMWDFDAGRVKINESSICECITAGLYKECESSVLMDIWNKVKLYFSDIEYMSDYESRLKVLKQNYIHIQSDAQLRWCKQVSFYTLSSKTLSHFEGFLNFIKDISERLFLGKLPDEKIDYAQHFKELMDIIADSKLHIDEENKEKELIDGIRERFKEYEGNPISGSIEDVQEAISFYLANNSKQGDSANLIVKDFEQVDGGVLLSERKNGADIYHLALISNKHMTKKATDLLSWPMTTEMFEAYKDIEEGLISAVPVVIRGIEERKEFLRYSLFYAAFFTHKEIELSYVAEEDGEQQTAYYILRALGLEEKNIAAQERYAFRTRQVKNTSSFNRSIRKEVEEWELFSICPYKYLLAKGIKEPIVYHSDYHIKYYVSNEVSIEIINGCQEQSLEDQLNMHYTKIKTLFPFWNELVIMDLKRTSERNIQNSTDKANLTYIKRKRNFLIAQWKETDRVSKLEHRLMNFRREDADERAKNYMESGIIYPHQDDLPYKKVCEHCSYIEICLRNYYGVREDD